MKLAVKLTTQRWLIMGLTAATGIIHLGLGLGDLGNFFGWLMLLNGLGYFGLLAAYFFDLPLWPFKRAQTRSFLMAFAAVTILAYLAINLNNLGALGIITKLIEAALIFLLWKDAK